MTRPTHCCGCITLRFGTKIQGWFGLIVCLFGLCTYVYVFTHEDSVRSSLNRNLRRYMASDSREEIVVYLDNMTEFMIYGMCFCSVMIVVNILLLVGVENEKRKLMIPWLGANIVIVVVETLYKLGAPIFSGRGLITILSNMIGAAISGLIGLYLWRCVYNHYLNVKNGPQLDEPIPSQRQPQKYVPTTGRMQYQGQGQYRQEPPQYQQGAAQYQGVPQYQHGGPQYQQGAQQQYQQYQQSQMQQYQAKF